MDCPICEKGEIKDYADGTCHCNNKKCQLPYNPPEPVKADLRKKQARNFYENLTYYLYMVWMVKPALIVVASFLCGVLLVISWVWICTTMIGGV